eukprot:6774809-Alexandrium_andersonii.AAC.1
MSASLVGSEMCIRDRRAEVDAVLSVAALAVGGVGPALAPAPPLVGKAVSYTHLTLPTICSV